MVWYPKKGFEAFGLTLLIEGKYIESTFFKCLFSLFCSVICNLFGALDWEMGCSLLHDSDHVKKKSNKKVGHSPPLEKSHFFIKPFSYLIIDKFEVFNTFDI